MEVKETISQRAPSRYMTQGQLSIDMLDQQLENSDVVKLKQKLLVQVKKDSNQQKGARVSTHINLPSKYIVLMPNTDIITRQIPKSGIKVKEGTKIMANV